MNGDEARRHVRDALLQVVPDADLEHLADGESLRDALELDSLDFLAFVESLSASTGVRLDEVDYPRLTTMDSCVLLLTTAPVPVHPRSLAQQLGAAVPRPGW